MEIPIYRVRDPHSFLYKTPGRTIYRNKDVSSCNTSFTLVFAGLLDDDLMMYWKFQQLLKRSITAQWEGMGDVESVRYRGEIRARS